MSIADRLPSLPMFLGFIEESALDGSASLFHAVSNIYGCAIIGSIKQRLRRHRYVLYGVSLASDPPPAICLPVVVVVVFLRLFTTKGRM